MLFRSLFVASGHCVWKSDRLCLSSTADYIEKIQFYWVVPSAKKLSWVGKMPKTKENQLLSKCLGKYVEQFVLIMEAKDETEKEDDLIAPTRKKQRR